MASVTTQKMRTIDSIVDQLVSTGTYARASSQAIKGQCKQVVNNFLHLTPQQGSFTTNSGTTQTLLKLQGVVPTEFQGATYQTPIVMWIPQGFPSIAPVVYVTPTTGMTIQHGHKHVDMSGLVHIPALQQWNPTESQAVIAIVELCSHFSAHPPLRARSAAPQPRSEPPFSAGSLRPPMSGASPQGASARGGPSTPPPTGGITRQVSMESEAEKARYREKVSLKMQHDMRGVLEQLCRDVDQEYDLQGKVAASASRLQEHEDELEQHHAALRSYEAQLTSYVDALSLWVAQNESVELGPDTVGSLVQPTDVLSAQLLRTVAEAAAIEDSYALLSKALEAGTISVQEYVKEARRRGKRQYELKALAKTIQTEQAKAFKPPAPTPTSAPPYMSGGQHGTPPGAHHAPQQHLVYTTGGITPAAAAGGSQDWVVVPQAAGHHGPQGSYRGWGAGPGRR